ncbi:MAG: molybdopterin molybdenumtransferase MoeA [Phycisphaerae bacterium]|nr:molybdopterin molybdotransferase MoeA [Phycisphaerae bacterium]NIP53331.1 molybdopterin molybdotransferase MoeA [Phycisphaerae bacterium]NIS49966.1 molybdopterin molybdotransferase MoeA [Phycisphaerae bacterium]NIU07670.1 molybdopterin molybdotransferase MoeA [Phycisphaerae bacterium]NIU57535.1 molybdopterin molybdenumtransferase MoeA [Phycisphaerae bacterium]
MMLKFDDAFEIVMDSARQLGTERVDIECALNRVLAEDISSDMDLPPFNKSAMDGFACRRAELGNELTVIETIPAGYTPKKAIGKNECSKIMTGAVVPEGADCVIMVEFTEKTADNKIRFTGGKTTDNICLKGEDIKKGEVVVRGGIRILAQHIAVLASLGCSEPLVSVQPRVGIIATGSELVDPGQKPSACQIRNSNAFQLAAQVTDSAGIATNYGIAADTEEAIDSMFKKAAAENDVLIFSGGVSMGDYDLVPGILEKNNVRLLFEKIAVKPGRPTVFGVSNEIFCFGLPGNPVSTFIIFELFVKPFLFKMMGHDLKPVVIYRQLERTITRKKTERDSWLPVVFTENNKVTSIEYHGSAHINALSEADGVICIPTGIAEIKEGTTVAVRQI